MKGRRVRSFALAATLLASGCSHAVKDQAELIRATLDGHVPPPVIVLPAELPEATKRAARSVGRTVNQGSVPASKEWTLPPGYFVLQQVEASGTRGSVAGVFGPVPAPRPGVGLLGCGRRVVVRFTRQNGRWQPAETQEVMC